MSEFHQSTFRYPDSYVKTLHQIADLATEPVQIGSKIINPPSEVVLSPTFFKVWGCELYCGACCPAFSLDYLPGEVDRLIEIYPSLSEQIATRETIEVNKSPSLIVSIKQEPKSIHRKSFCRFLNLKTKACNIHKMNPLSCQIELVKVRRIRNRGYIMKAPFGRAWTMLNAHSGVRGDVRCTFEVPLDTNGLARVATQIINTDLPALRRLLRWSEYFNIKTKLPAVIEYLEAGNLEPRRF